MNPLEIVCDEVLSRIQSKIARGYELPFNVIGFDSGYVSKEAVRNKLSSEFGINVSFFHGGFAVSKFDNNIEDLLDYESISVLKAKLKNYEEDAEFHISKIKLLMAELEDYKCVKY